MSRDTTRCERCEIYIGHRPHIVAISSPLSNHRYRLCVRCRDRLTEALEQTLVAWETADLEPHVSPLEREFSVRVDEGAAK